MKIISKQQIVGLLDSSFVPDFPELGVMGRILTLQPRYQVVSEAISQPSVCKIYPKQCASASRLRLSQLQMSSN